MTANHFHKGHSLEVIWSETAPEPFVGLWCHDCEKYLEIREYPSGSLVFYVASPLSAADPETVAANMRRAMEYETSVAALLKADFPDEQVFAYAPHASLPAELDDTDPSSREAAMAFDFEVLRHCSGLVVCGSVISAGMQQEIEFAKENGIPLYRFENGRLEMCGNIRCIANKN